MECTGYPQTKICKLCLPVLVQFEFNAEALPNSSPGRGPRAGSPRGVEVRVEPWGCLPNS